MGISGLIPFLEKASRKTNIKEFAGHTVAVDTYCWLHKGVFGCAEKLIRGEDSDIYIQYCLKYVNLLLSHNIKPILVFDGRHLPAKALTEKRRRETRDQCKKRAAELLRLGRNDEAKTQMRRCIDITHNMALKLIQECRNRNIDCIVAPYEADAQLGFLNKLKIAQYIITEDSDLVLFGCENILFKLDLTGNCLLAEASKLHLAMGCHPDKYTFDKFRRMCIISGCDYLDSLPGIGLAKACKFIMKTEETNMGKALKKIPQCLNMRNLLVDDNYIDSFLRAEACFKYMFIYNPFKRKMERLNELINHDDEEFCSNAGTLIDDDTAFQLAIGNLNPFTLEKLDDWSPDRISNKKFSKTDNWKQVSKTKHLSIWQPQFKPHLPKQHQSKLSGFQFKKIDYKPVKLVINDEVENESENECSVISLYNQDNYNTNKLQKRKIEETDDESDNDLNISNKKRNPFVKQSVDDNSPKKTKITEENSSLLKVISPRKNSQNFFIKSNHSLKQKSEVRSRFFFSNTIISPKIKSKLDDENNLEHNKLMNEIKSSQEEIKRKQSLLYSPEKIIDDCSKKCESTDKDLKLSDVLTSNLDDISVEISSESDWNKIEKENLLESSALLEKFEFKNFRNNDSIMQDDIIEISEDEVSESKCNILNVPKKSQKNIRLGLSNKGKLSKSKTVVGGNSQSKLSMFGFQKKSLLKTT